MTHSFKLSRRIARLRVPIVAALVVAFGACDNMNAPDSTTPPESQGQSIPDSTTDTLALAADGLSFSSSFSGGIPMGLFAMPTTWFGGRYNGALRTIGPYELKSQLAAIKSRGGRIVLMLAGSESNYKDGSGHFSLTKWKQRIDRFRGINFSSYVSDGTIIAHYLIDEPQDKSNWNGQAVPQSTVDEMGRYSKQLWPGMATVVRTAPRYFTSNPRYVDAAWAQYLSQFGDVNTYIRQSVSDAQRRGLALIVGLNIRHGGYPKGSAMSASEVVKFGSALLSNSYPCALISWQYMSSYLSTAAMKDAMDLLRRKAQSRGARACRGS
jgi:hypothetical protein